MLRVGQFRNRHGEIAHPTGVAHWSLTEWCLAAFGELGETANLIKKLNRGELLPTDTALQDEIADTVIYLDLLASRAGFDLGAAIRAKFNRKSQEIGVNVFL
jgi:NTP pyrophosphatase (non-canonical NTP hydrolase)